ncbi:unnamed protein product [Pleuronectes platessa]|uniref:Uncharacterized protein n=1 Tax=Pleuronectes platessa TaxID=8262 RepID=A0A9N7VQD4_PLEPL|nr:unnamed protein product [Pleuronectes platessa]
MTLDIEGGRAVKNGESSYRRSPASVKLRLTPQVNAENIHLALGSRGHQPPLGGTRHPGGEETSQPRSSTSSFLSPMFRPEIRPHSDW